MSMIKKKLEQEIEAICDCGAGGLLDPEEHDTYCTAYRCLIMLGY